MKMKRIISLLLCVLLAAAFCAGCSFSSGKDEKAPDAPASDTAPADDAAAPSQEPAPSGDAESAEKPGEPAGTDWPDTSEDTSLPEIETPSKRTWAMSSSIPTNWPAIPRAPSPPARKIPVSSPKRI